MGGVSRRKTFRRRRRKEEEEEKQAAVIKVNDAVKLDNREENTEREVSLLTYSSKIT